MLGIYGRVVTFSLALALTAVTAFGGEKYVLKLSTQLNETTPMVQGFNKLAATVKEKSGGRLVIEVYPSAQLGSD